MNKKLLVLIFLCFFVFYSGVLAKGKEETGSEQKWDIRDLDAMQIKLEDIKKVVDGRYPRWSPDGKKILYTEEDLNGIWMINPDGSNNEQITEDGYWAAWSPNGKRIAYTRYKRPKRHEIHQIAIFDLKAKKEYIIWEQNSETLDRPSRSFLFDKIEWTKDGKKLFFVHQLMRKIDFINLDDLSFEVNMTADYELAGGVNNNLTHPLFNIYMKTYCYGPARGRQDPLIHLDFANYIPSELNSDQKEKLCGIWAENKKGIPFAIRLLDGNSSNPELSPDLAMLLFQNRYDIYVAKISKFPTSHIKHYEVPLGLKDGLKKKNILFVSTPKINPLNNKLIGWDKEVIKGTVIIESVEKDRALVRTLLLIKDFEQNDVAVNIHNKSFGYLKRK